MRTRDVGATIPRIRNPEAYAEGQWDLDILSPAFSGTNIKPADIDGAIWNSGGVVETQSSVLFLEFKGPAASVPLGQDLLFRTLCTPRGFHVLVVSGTRNQPERYCFWTPDGPGNWRDCTLAELIGLVRRWFLSVRNGSFERTLK